MPHWPHTEAPADRDAALMDARAWPPGPPRATDRSVATHLNPYLFQATATA